ncbi:hypothetical protein [Nitrosomonas europaea]|nr:hypothetical protein [Nitrosomonas europaea]
MPANTLNLPQHPVLRVEKYYISTEPVNMTLICPHCQTYPHSSV